MDFVPQHLVLDCGRRLAFSTLGPDGGLPVLYLHGGIGSRLDATDEMRRCVRELGVQWVAVSRPGFGASDPHPERTAATVARDVGVLVDTRQWQRLLIVGVSSGGPFALTCAAHLEDRVAGVALAASLSPVTPAYLAAGVPRRVRWFLRMLVRHPNGAARILGIGVRGARLAERLLGSRLATRHAGPLRAIVEATACGVRGLIDDFSVAVQPGWRPAGGLNVPVHIWHGGRDPVSPPEDLVLLAGSLPRGEAFVDPDESHFFFRRRCAEIVERLVHASDAAAPQLAT